MTAVLVGRLRKEDNLEIIPYYTQSQMNEQILCVNSVTIQSYSNML